MVFRLCRHCDGFNEHKSNDFETIIKDPLGPVQRGRTCSMASKKACKALQNKEKMLYWDCVLYYVLMLHFYMALNVLHLILFEMVQSL